MAQGGGIGSLTGLAQGATSRAAARGRDVANFFNSMTQGAGMLDRAMQRIGRDTARVGQNLAAAEHEVAKAGATASQAQIARVRQLQDELKKLDNQARAMKGLGRLGAGVDNLGKKLLGLHTTIMSMGFGWLKSSIEKVYELQERWAGATGRFNIALGAMTKGLRSSFQEATRWEGTVRGLTDNFGEGLKLFQDYSLALGKVVQKGDK